MSEPVTRLVLIRHGHAQAAVDGVVAGHEACRGLSELGRAQARALHDRLAASGELEPDLVYASVLPRAIETAEIIAPALGGLDVARDCDLCELHPGECDGLTWEEYRARYRFDMRADPEQPMSPGGESLASFQARVEARIARLADEHRGRSVVIVCHGGVIRAATLGFLNYGLHMERRVQLEAENTSITEWVRPEPDETSEARWWLVRFNDSAHLAQVGRDGRPGPG